MGFEEVIFESDSMNLLEALRDPGLWPRLSSYTDDILTTPRREVNGCADLLASKASSLSIYQAFLDCSPPIWLIPNIEKEKLVRCFRVLIIILVCLRKKKPNKHIKS